MFQSVQHSSERQSAATKAVRPEPPGKLAIGNQAALQRLQAKLTISQPGDSAELEADRVAEQVMRMPGPVVEGTVSASERPKETLISRKCEECEEDEKKSMQRKPDSQLGPAVNGGAPALVDRALASQGRSLDPWTRAFMESRFNQDFGHVRIHAGPAAGDSARAVNALAYTVGSDVVFRPESYAPETAEGRRLLAHELTHVVQQAGAGGARGLPEAAASHVATSAAPAIMRSPGACEDKCESGFEQCKTSSKAEEQCGSERTSCLKGCEGQQPEAPGAAAPKAAPAAKPAVVGKDSAKRDYVLYENEARVGGTRTWRNNNPGNFDKAKDHPKNIGTDGRFLIFPDPATGKQELIDDVKAEGKDNMSIRTFISNHAPPSENPTETYITDVVSYLNNASAIGECKIAKPAKWVTDGTILGNLSADERVSFAMAVAREEGYCDVSQKKDLFTCESPKITEEYKNKLSCK
jgi:hypothetical protein